MDIHEQFMNLALMQAKNGLEQDEVPIGAVIVKDHSILAAAYNQTEMLADPTAHAEMIAITQAAAALTSWRLIGCTLYTTLEPCPMCAGAIIQARISKVVFGASDLKAGACESLYHITSDERLNHQADVLGGILADQCGAVLSTFFHSKRNSRGK